MPGPNYGRSAQDLIDIGLLPETPCAVVSHAGRTTEQVRTATLGSLQSVTDVPAPAVLIVGEVARANLSTQPPRLWNIPPFFSVNSSSARGWGENTMSMSLGSQGKISAEI